MHPAAQECECAVVHIQQLGAAELRLQDIGHLDWSILA